MNPFENRDLHTILLFPVLSWSSLCAFTEYDKDEWYERYVLGKEGESNPAMKAGRVIGERLATDPSYLPAVPRPAVYEKELRGDLGKIKLVGHLDGWTPKEPGIDEFKTTQNPNKWTQETVDKWGQITFYCLLVWLNFGIMPEALSLRLTSILLKEDGKFALNPTGEIHTFKTKRTMRDVLVFGARLMVVHKEMEEYIASKENLR